jgi:hypothetical protein
MASTPVLWKIIVEVFGSAVMSMSASLVDGRGSHSVYVSSAQELMSIELWNWF